MKHYKVTFYPEGRSISVLAGTKLIDAAGMADIILNSSCGGIGTCRKCAVFIKPENEEVLACQYSVQSDLIVDIPSASRFFEQKILEHGITKNIQIEPANTYGTSAYGCAIDVGTTTIVIKLIDLNTGNCLATQATFNPQIKFGDDVISRITYADTDEKLNELNSVLVNSINKLIKDACLKANVNQENIYEVTVVGNTAMNHIFLKLPIKQLGQAPYTAYSVDAFDVPAAKMGIKINPDANIHTVENIAGFVGSDTTAVALAVDIDTANEMTLVVDIGTNGEIILGTHEKLYSASCAAGPALEGARILQGSRAVAGAIESVVINDNDIDVEVIGNKPAASICGSGLIDAVAVMLNLGVIDFSGRFLEKNELSENLSENIKKRLIEKDGFPAFILTFNEKDNTPSVILTQQDIRQMQLAKAAIRAGIKLLQNKFSIKDDDIRHILMAGAFGNYIRRESALRIGLLPTVPIERIKFVGNAACSGAQMVLLSKSERIRCGKIAKKIQYIEIAHDPQFTDVFADCLLFD